MADDTQTQDDVPMVTRTHVMNASALTVMVPIVNTVTGEKDSIFLQPGGKPYLAKDFVPDPVWMRFNPKIKSVTVSVPSTDTDSVSQPE